MDDISKRILTVRPPVDRPDRVSAFAALASIDGWQQAFNAKDRETGEMSVIIFEASALPEAA